MDRIKITLVLALTCIIIIGTTCLAVTGIVNAQRGLVLREEASTSATPLTTVPDDQEVEIIENLGEWYKVKYGIYEGYLYAEYVDAEEEATQPEAQEQTEENTATQEGNAVYQESTYPQNITTKSEVKAYILPSVTSKVVTTIQTEKPVIINYALNNWFNITYEGKEYWIRKYSINGNPVENTDNNNTESNPEEKVEETKPENTTTFTPIDNKKGYIDVNSAANVRERADTSADVITTLLRNTDVTIIGEEGDFYKIQYKDITGYVAKSLVSDNPVETTSRGGIGEREKTVVEEQSSNVNDTNNIVNPQTISASSEGERIANFAKQYVGCKYVYGGTTPSGFDCTGFAYYVYNSCGISLSRSCSVQAQTGVEVGRQSRDELQAGDLLLFANGNNGSIGHVGIYIGDGYFVHAKNSNSGVVIDHLTNNPYYNQYYYSGRRIVN